MIYGTKEMKTTGSKLTYKWNLYTCFVQQIQTVGCQNFLERSWNLSQEKGVWHFGQTGSNGLMDDNCPCDFVSTKNAVGKNMLAVGQNLRYLFGDDYPPKVVYFKGFWDVHLGTGVLTHCHIVKSYK